MSGIQTAIDHMGSAPKLAKTLGVTAQAVYFWRDGLRKIPADICIEIEKSTGALVRCEHLRPDVDWQYLRVDLTGIAQAATENVAKQGA